MSKVKVYELAKQLNITNTEVIEKLKKVGIEVKSHLSSIEKEQADLLNNKVNDKLKTSNKVEGNNKNISSKAVDSPHIIRRQVKVINTSDNSKTVDEITTSITGDIKKTHRTVSNMENNKNNREDLGVISPRNAFNKRNNNSNNIVVTRNGKLIEENEVKKDSMDQVNTVEDKIEAKANDIVKEEKKVFENSDNKKENSNYQNRGTRPNNYNQNSQNRDNNGYRNNYNQDGQNRDNNNSGYRNNYNQNGQQNRDNNGYRSNYNQNGQNRDNNNSGYRNNYNQNGQQNRDNNGYRSNYNQNGQNRDNNNSGYRNNYNQNGQQNRDNNGYRSNYNQNGQNRDNNNSGYRNNYNQNGQQNRDNNGYRSNYNQNGQNRDNNNSGYRSNYNQNGQQNRDNNGYRSNYQNRDNTSFQVNKFMKTTTTVSPLEVKETRTFVPSSVDKKRYNSDNNSSENKKDKINKNNLREQHSRVSTSKLKGLEINNSGQLIDLYERDTDLSRKFGNKRKKQHQQKLDIQHTKIIPMTEVKLPESMTVKEFAEALKKQSSDIIKKLFGLGIMATVNQEIDFDTAYLIASEFGITAEKQVVVTEEDILFDDSEDEEENLVARPPIVVVMGHVDHGKTSLLDRIRSESVVQTEAGGITQHIGAYKVEINKKEICFLDTPGHEAFTQMRARGAQVTDIAIIVVAADDGIKPQTIEAIDHAKAAGVSIIVAINKIDKPAANIDKVKQELLEVGLVAEEWGGDTICVPISAKSGEGIENLLEMILLVADMKDLKANPNKQAKGTILEARIDKNSGTTISMLVQRGMLNVGDTIVVGDTIGKIRAMKDDKGRKVKLAGPSTPVEVIGLSEVPQTGEVFYEVENEKVAKHLVEKRKASVRQNLIKQGSKVTLNDLFSQIQDGKIKELNLIIKADVQGSVEALKDSLLKLNNDEVRIRILHASTGGIKESDVTLASVSNAIIIGFNVRPESTAAIQADKEKVDLRLYRVIYDAIADVDLAMKGMLEPTYKEVVLGSCEVRQLFKVSSVGTIAGCYVKTGKIVRNTMIRVIRDSIVVHEGKLDSLKREKADVKEVATGFECGIKLEGFNDIQEGDSLECFEMKAEKRV